jgi:class 3 adenylate cyclase/tetratricopeptide (TPR) repeat protein
MLCARCGTENRQGRRFCAECGASLPLACSACGFSNEADEKFCGGCGASLAPAPTGAAKFATPQSYTPRHLAEKILTSRGALEGERKQVTVLFADLKGSMELLADRDPEEARKILDPVLELMMEAVHRYEGTVNQVMGDGIMALFGAPVAHEDHAIRACYAAMCMQEAVAQHAEGIFRTHAVPLQIRVGLNSGEVVVRSIGNDLRMDYTAVGQTTHLAARMEQIANAGSVLLTGETLKLAEGYVQVKRVGLVPVKGLERLIEVYELIGTGPTRTRFQITAARGLTRFVGRQTEFQLLDHALERAEAGHGQVLALVGEPGVGKSRLVWEFAHSHRAAGWRILESGAVSYGKSMPYRPVIDLLKTYLQIEDRDDAQSIREKLTAKLLALDRALESTVPALHALLDVPVEDPEWQALDPPRRRQRTLEACERLVLRESQAQPLLLVFEDLQWIDTETQAFLDNLVESLPSARLLLIVNYRPEYEEPQHWTAKNYHSQLRVDPLPPATAEELFQALLGPDPSLQSLKPFLVEWTQGNPFFLEESVRALLDGDVIVGIRGAYRLVAPHRRIEVPKTVQAILAARIDRLPPEEKRLLQAAAVIGKDVPFTLLRTIIDGPDEDLREGLSHLQTAEFLYETTVFPDPEYTFKHLVTHEVAYGSLLRDRRRALHAQIVAAIEHFYPHRLTEQYERLAHHASRGEMWQKALQYSRRAGAKALARSAYREAAESFKQSLLALNHLPTSSDTMQKAIDIQIRLHWALFPIGEYDSCLPYLESAEVLATSLGDRSRLGVVSALLAGLSFVVAKHNRAVEYGERALAIAAASGDLTLQLQANFFLGQANLGLGAYHRARDYFTKNLDPPPTGLTGILYSILSHAWVAWSLAELGELPTALARAEEALNAAEAVGDQFCLVNAIACVGNVRVWKGDLAEAIPLLERGLALSHDARNQSAGVLVGAMTGHAYALSGRLNEAVTLLEQSIKQGEKGMGWGYSLLVGFLGRAYLQVGRVEHALERAQLALDLSRAHQERGHEAYAIHFLGEIVSHHESPDEAMGRSRYQQALLLAEGLSMRPLVAHCHLGLGKLYRRTGKRERAQEHLTTATTMYREMDMRFWLERAEAEAEVRGWA